MIFLVSGAVVTTAVFQVGGLAAPPFGVGGLEASVVAPTAAGFFFGAPSAGTTSAFGAPPSSGSSGAFSFGAPAETPTTGDGEFAFSAVGGAVPAPAFGAGAAAPTFSGSDSVDSNVGGGFRGGGLLLVEGDLVTLTGLQNVTHLNGSIACIVASSREAAAVGRVTVKLCTNAQTITIKGDCAVFSAPVGTRVVVTDLTRARNSNAGLQAGKK